MLKFKCDNVNILICLCGDCSKRARKFYIGDEDESFSFSISFILSLVHPPNQSMADFISPIVDILTRLCSYCSERSHSIRDLGDNLNCLRKDLSDLNNRYLDIEMMVNTAEQDPNPELTVKNEVRGWMRSVQDLQSEVQDILKQGDQEIQATCFGGRCPKNCRSSYRLSKRATQKLSDISDLMNKGHFDVVAEKFACDRFDKLPLDTTVGVETTFEELCSCFENNEVHTIGLYGMGGVGKTTLLKKFNNDFLSTKANYVVIWVVASKDADPGKIQDVIRKKLHVQDDIWSNEMVDGRTLLLYNILNGKKFVLLLDDVWERIDLLKLGVPSPNDHDCKIIFTTRSKEVCGLMGAQRHIRVQCLTPDKAYELFKEKVGGTTLESPHILHLAKQVVDECQGLPLALCTVGRAMANKVTPNEWRRSIEILRSYPSKVQGIVDEVYHLLEFSYDRLPDAYKSCFSYCALFPEDYNIPEEELILLWIGEGFLAEVDDDIYEARKQGEDIISGLKYACLLESGDYEGALKMHDVVRDMALWVSCDHGKSSRFFVGAPSVISGHEVYNRAKWKDVERLSIWGETFPDFSQKPHCPKLITLLIRETSLEVFPTEVLVLPTTVRVLDLSSNRKISYLPSAIGDFVNLEYMDLSETCITKLPEELKNLKKLRFLLLNRILWPLEFPKGVLSGLVSLQVFSFRSASLNPMVDELVLLNELEVLGHLQDIHMFAFEISSVEKILISSKLQRCMCDLRVYVSSPLHDLLSSLGKMEHLETLHVVGPEKSEAANNPMRSPLWGHNHPIIILRQLIIVNCHNIIDLSFLIHAPNLEYLLVQNCDSLVEVISEDLGTERVESSNLFCSLTYLYLMSLSSLRGICGMALQCPCLKEIIVTKCANLKKLPFNSQSALKNLQHFREGSREWLDQLEWEDEATKHLLLSKYRSWDE